MSSILYYSKLCEHSNKLLYALSRCQTEEKIHYICIDKREKSQNGQIVIILENGEKLLLPSEVVKVPSLLLLNRGHRVLTGNEIMEYLMPPVEQQVTNQVNNDPEAFSLNNASSMSDNFSFWDMSPDDLAAKGDGGMRTINNFYSVSQQDKINTPPDDYTPNKVNQGEVDKFQEGRDTLINKPNLPKKVNFSD
jgi:hypothetical protein